MLISESVQGWKGNNHEHLSVSLYNLADLTWHAYTSYVISYTIHYPHMLLIFSTNTKIKYFTSDLAQKINL